MNTTHKIVFENSKNMGFIPSESVDLMITSPSYPMIEMWDEHFNNQNPEIKEALLSGKGRLAFELMNVELDKVWDEVYRVLKEGGIACINIGDATRKLDSKFQLYPSHARILNHCLDIGFDVLPEILWRKPTNAPNKFMGSGMLPPSAYVTLEHEYILVLRKGGLRKFKTLEEKINRQQSAFFWEERNLWFSDIWTDLKGISQKLNYEKVRNRSAAYPFELAYRLTNMFSVKGDTVLDPFFGTGTTTYAAIASCRNSIGFEIDTNLKGVILSRVNDIKDFANNYMRERLKRHLDFVADRTKEKGPLKYKNINYGFPVMTKQEQELILYGIESFYKSSENTFEAIYKEKPQEEIYMRGASLLVAKNNKIGLQLAIDPMI